jgi:hypothetical protein
MTMHSEGAAGQCDADLFVRAIFHNACNHKAVLKEEEEGWDTMDFHRAIETPLHSSCGRREGGE